MASGATCFTAAVLFVIALQMALVAAQCGQANEVKAAKTKTCKAEDPKLVVKHECEGLTFETRFSCDKTWQLVSCGCVGTTLDATHKYDRTKDAASGIMMPADCVEPVQQPSQPHVKAINGFGRGHKFRSLVPSGAPLHVFECTPQEGLVKRS